MKILVNGKQVEFSVPADISLLLFLRNTLGLTGTKQGCSMGECRTCLVLVGGTPTTSCDVRIADLEGAEVTTVEGLTDTVVGRALAETFVEHQAGQCGYCLSGILVAAAAGLSAAPDLHRDEAHVRQTLDANICRCGAHQRIVDAVLSAARRPPPPGSGC